MYGDYVHLDSGSERSQSTVVDASDQHGWIGWSPGDGKFRSLGSVLTLCELLMLHNDDPCPVRLTRCRRLVDLTIGHDIATLSRWIHSPTCPLLDIDD